VRRHRLARRVTPSRRLIFAATAASSALTGSSTETAFDNVSLSLAANTSKAGDTYEFEAQGIVTAHNASDTLTVKVKIGSTVIVTTGASTRLGQRHLVHRRAR
jgi:hypothetical protein